MTIVMTVFASTLLYEDKHVTLLQRLCGTHILVRYSRSDTSSDLLFDTHELQLECPGHEKTS
jgi:hypothetical protein